MVVGRRAQHRTSHPVPVGTAVCAEHVVAPIDAEDGSRTARARLGVHGYRFDGLERLGLARVLFSFDFATRDTHGCSTHATRLARHKSTARCLGAGKRPRVGQIRNGFDGKNDVFAKAQSFFEFLCLFFPFHKHLRVGQQPLFAFPKEVFVVGTKDILDEFGCYALQEGPCKPHATRHAARYGILLATLATRSKAAGTLKQRVRVAHATLHFVIITRHVQR